MINITSWSNGSLIKGKKTIDSFNAGLNYGVAIWEGIRSYIQTDKTVKIFRLKEHIDRLFDSAKIIGLDVPYSKNDLIQGCIDLVESNEKTDLYIRPVIYLGNDAEGKKEYSSDILVDIHVCKINDSNLNKGQNAIISSYIRGYPEYDMQCKCSGNYHKIYDMHSEASNSGADHAFVRDRKGYIVETATSNVFVQKGEEFFTPPNDGSILPGITRQIIINLINSQKIFHAYDLKGNVKEKPITRADIYTADGIFLTGTMCELLPIMMVDKKPVGGAKPTKHFEILYLEYQKLTRGNNG